MSLQPSHANGVVDELNLYFPPELSDMINAYDDLGTVKVKVEANTLTKIAGAIYHYFFKWITLGFAWILKFPNVAIQNWRYKTALLSGKDDAIEVAKSALRWGADAHLSENHLITLSRNGNVNQLTFHLAQQSLLTHQEWRYQILAGATLGALPISSGHWVSVKGCFDHTVDELRGALLNIYKLADRKERRSIVKAYLNLNPLKDCLEPQFFNTPSWAAIDGDYFKLLLLQIFLDAIKEEDFETIKVFFESGLSPKDCISTKYPILDPNNTVPLVFQDLSLESIKLWLKHGFDPETLLTACVRNHNFESVEYLLGRGADPNKIVITDGKGSSALIEAVKSGNLEITKLLLTHSQDSKNNADPNKIVKTDGEGSSALVEAVKLGNLEIARVLLTCSENPNENANPNLILYAKGERICALIEAIKLGNLEMTGLLLANNADPNIKLPRGPLRIAIENQNLGLCEILLKHGATITPSDKVALGKQIYNFVVSFQRLSN
jgi:hypothetical protein